MGRATLVTFLSLTLENRTLSGGNYSQAQVNRWSRVSERAHRYEIHARLGVGTHVFEIDSSRALQWNPAVGMRTSFHRLSNLLDWHVIQQNCFRTVSQRLLELGQSAHLHFDGLSAAAVAVGSFEHWLNSA